MPARNASVVWNGTLREGKGHLKLGSGVYEGPYTYASRFESAPGTNPEELIAAAHAGCFSMYLSALLTKDKFTPTSINTTATVYINQDLTIPLIELNTEAVVPGLDDAAFQKYAADAKQGCPVSKALAGPEIRLTAKLL